MTHNYKINLNRGKHRRNLVSYLTEEEEFVPEKKSPSPLQKKFEKFRKRYSSK
jgi:hypothetical protein